MSRRLEIVRFLSFSRFLKANKGMHYTSPVAKWMENSLQYNFIVGDVLRVLAAGQFFIFSSGIIGMHTILFVRTIPSEYHAYHMTLRLGVKYLHAWRIKGIYLSKALTCMKSFQYKQKLFFYQGDGYLWPHCCMSNGYISHRSLYAPIYSFWAICSMLISLFRVTSWFDTVCNIVTR